MSEEVNQRAAAAARKTAPFGPDLDLDAYAADAPEQDRPAVTHLIDEAHRLVARWN